MRVIEPKHIIRKSKKRRNRRITRIICVGLVLILCLITVCGAYMYARPLSPIGASAKPLTISPQTVAVPWPTIGQAAVGAVGYGLLDKHGDDTPRPMASVNKVLTALVILEKKPLTINESGPIITITAEDVSLYNKYIEQGGSVVRVNAGEQISEYQALQAMLLPSANNMSDSLAIWAYGSIDDYLVAANNFATKLGMSKTRVTDSNGLSPSVVSTVSDFILLGEAALQNKVIADIVAQPTANIPVHGLIRNVNVLLGINGVNGIKTGNTDEAGGCFLGSSTVVIDGQRVTILVAIMGATDLEAALRSSQQIITAAQKGFGTTKLFIAGTVVGQYKSPWQGDIPAVLNKDVTKFGWLATPLSPAAILYPIKAPLSNGTKVGFLKITGNPKPIESEIVISKNVDLPTVNWRLKNIVSKIHRFL